jgi:hypothetical protein
MLLILRDLDRLRTYVRGKAPDAVLARNAGVRFIVSPCKGAALGSTATTVPTQRDSHIRSINEHKRMYWQKTSGYNRHSKIRAAIGRCSASCYEQRNDRACWKMGV